MAECSGSIQKGEKNEVELEGETGSMDENRIVTLNAVFLAESYDEVFNVGGDAREGLVESGRSWTARNDGSGGYIVTVTYKGQGPEDAGGGPNGDEQGEQWSADFDFSEEPLEQHPKFDELIKTYGGIPNPDGETFRFLPKLPADVNAGGLGAKKKLGAGDKNPMYGVKTFAVMQARVSRSYSSKQINPTLMSDIGKVEEKLPASGKVFKDLAVGDRNWLCQPPQIQQNGDTFRITQQWLLSPPGGWTDLIYELIQKE